MWNNKYISNVQITLSETLGIEDRGQYYDSTGALKDMVQNHALQILTLIAMEKPESRNSKDIRLKNRTFKQYKILKGLMYTNILLEDNILMVLLMKLR